MTSHAHFYATDLDPADGAALDELVAFASRPLSTMTLGAPGPRPGYEDGRPSFSSAHASEAFDLDRGRLIRAWAAMIGWEARLVPFSVAMAAAQPDGGATPFVDAEARRRDLARQDYQDSAELPAWLR